MTTFTDDEILAKIHLGMHRHWARMERIYGMGDWPDAPPPGFAAAMGIALNGPESREAQIDMIWTWFRGYAEGNALRTSRFMAPQPEEYIGDGVYVSMDEAAQIWVLTPAQSSYNEIALEMPVMNKLIGYAKSEWPGWSPKL